MVEGVLNAMRMTVLKIKLKKKKVKRAERKPCPGHRVTIVSLGNPTHSLLFFVGFELTRN